MAAISGPGCVSLGHGPQRCALNHRIGRAYVYKNRRKAYPVSLVVAGGDPGAGGAPLAVPCLWLRRADGAPNVIDPAITAQPLAVVLWVRDTVTPENEAWITAKIEKGLPLWESVPTSHLRFDTIVIRSATRPATTAEQLLVRAINAADAEGTGGASFPSHGYPGEWFGAVADIPEAYRDWFHIVAAHEIGHAIGFQHSSVSDIFFGVNNNIPIMHWATFSVTGLTADDVAAISLAYPNPALPLETVTGTLRGRATSSATGLPLDGINAVAVEAGTGAPALGRLTDAAGVPGEFDLIGLPPGTYDVYLLDGRSFAGSSVGLPTERIQADNFEPMVLGSFTVGAGSLQALGDVPIAIESVSVDRIGRTKLASDVDPGAGVLPTASFGQPYEAWLHLRGGVPPLRVAASQGLPSGRCGRALWPSGSSPVILTVKRTFVSKALRFRLAPSTSACGWLMRTAPRPCSRTCSMCRCPEIRGRCSALWVTSRSPQALYSRSASSRFIQTTCHWPFLPGVHPMARIFCRSET